MGPSKIAAAIGIAIAGIAAAAPAGAQTSAATSTVSPAETTGSPEVADIIVTANRREENLQNVPIAIVAVSGETLERSGIDSTADLPNATAGLVFLQARGASTPFLRGVGTTNNGTQAEGPTALYVDGIYIFSQIGGLQSLASVERVEVLKGPQGTLFGRNATGGLINIITRTPSQTTALEAEIGYGNYETLNADLYATTGLSESLAMDFTFSLVDQSKGYGFNPTIGEEVNKRTNFTLRSKLFWEPSDTINITVAGDYVRNKGDEGRIFNIWRDSLGRNGQPYGLLLGKQDTASELSMRPNGVEQWGLSGRVEADLSGVQLVSITSYRNTVGRELFDPDYTPLPIVVFDWNHDQDAFTQEVQLLSPESNSFKWILGAFYLRNDLHQEQIDRGFIFGGLGGGREREFDQRWESLAGFGQVTIPFFADRAHATLGLRYTRDTISISGRERAFNATVFSDALPDRQRNGEFTYRASLDYRLAEDVLIYASFNRGYSAGQVLGFGAPASEPEFLDAFELGFKSDLFDRRLRLNGVFFHYDYTDLQIEVVNPINIIDAINAPSAKVNGIELEATVAVSRDFNLRANAAYIDSEYGPFANAPFFFPSPMGANTSTVGDATGKQLIGSPRWSFNFGGDLRIPMSNESEINLSANLGYVGRTYWDVQNRTFSEARAIVNGQVEYVFPGSNFSVKAWAKNITGNSYYLNVAPSGPLGDRARAGTPRTYGLSLGYRL